MHLIGLPRVKLLTSRQEGWGSTSRHQFDAKHAMANVGYCLFNDTSKCLHLLETCRFCFKHNSLNFANIRNPSFSALYLKIFSHILDVSYKSLSRAINQ